VILRREIFYDHIYWVILSMLLTEESTALFPGLDRNALPLKGTVIPFDDEVWC